VEVTQPRRVLVRIKRVALARALASAPGVGDSVDRIAVEQPLVPPVDLLDREVGLVPGEVQVLLAVDLLQEELRLLPVFIEVPGQRLQR
jgi:hypothetical protein